MKIKKIPPPEFKRIYSRVPRLCVEVVVVEKGGVLLVHRAIAPYKDQWHIPGGTVLKGETLAGTVKRVAKEELGIQVNIKKLLGIIEYATLKDYYGQAVGAAFLTSPKGKKKITLDSGGNEYAFFSRLPAGTIPEQKRFLQKVLGFKA